MQTKYVLEVPKAGLNVDVGAVPQDYNLHALSIHGPYFAQGNAIDATAGDFDPEFMALGIEKLRGSGERNGDRGDDRVHTITSIAGDIMGLRIPLDHPTETAWFEITAKLPF
jgi:hypothetical protein